MPDRDIQLTGAADTVHGATLSIHQDHDGVRIDAAFIEYTFDREQASVLRDAIGTALFIEYTFDREQAIALRDAIGTALYLAACWEANNADD